MARKNSAKARERSRPKATPAGRAKGVSRARGAKANAPAPEPVSEEPSPESGESPRAEVEPPLPEPAAVPEPEPELEPEAEPELEPELEGAEEEPASELAAAEEGAVVDESGVEDTRAFLKGLLEALIFVADHPLSMKELARAAKIDKKRTEELVAELAAEGATRGVRIEEVAGGLVLRSNPLYATYVRNFVAMRPVRLSRAQLETLAIIAYRQPLTRPEIDDIRGVDSGPVLKGLLERDLVKILGKKDEPGRPMLYGTTPAFLELFSMQSLRDLPTLKEFTELSEESRSVFEREIGEDAPEGPIDFGSGGASQPAEGGSDSVLPEEAAYLDDGADAADDLANGEPALAPQAGERSDEEDEDDAELEPGAGEPGGDEVDQDDDDDDDDDEDDDDDDDDDDEDDDDDDDDED